MIADTITQKIAEALKAKDEIRLSTLRLLSSALNYEFITKQHKLSSEEEIVVVKREAKKRKDAIEALEASRGKTTTSTIPLDERIAKEQKELAILKEFLPEEMGEEELQKLVEMAINETGASSLADMGKVIGLVMSKSGGRADGAVVANLVKGKLSA